MVPRLLISFTLGLAVFAAALWLFVISKEPGPGDIDPSYVLPISVIPVTRIEVVDCFRTENERRLTITDYDTIQAFVESLENADLRAELMG